MKHAGLDPMLKQNIGDAALAQRIAEILRSSLEAVDPYSAVRAALRREGETLWLGETACPLDEGGRVFLISVGKAAPDMARAAVDLLGPRVHAGAVVQKHPVQGGEGGLPASLMVFRGGHPVPNAGSLAAARNIRQILAETRERDLVLCLISGGGSALMTDPHEGLSLDEIQTLTGQLLACGARIDEINTIRKHLDQVKGGGLARAAHPARLLTLVLSDVVGNPLDMVASGPTVPDPTTFADALAILEKYDLKEEVPDAVLAHLAAGAKGQLPDTPGADAPIFERAQTRVVGSNLRAARAGLARAQEAGFNAQLLTTYLQGDAREAGRFLGAILRQVDESGQPLARPACLIAGGETTVVVKGEGLGGRNLEVALAAAREIAGLEKVVFISLATDGEDGPTDAAGAVVTGETMAAAAAHNLDAADFLARNDSYHFFEPLGALVRIGPTGTNVNDLSFLFAL